jgi:hypothetical protein
MADLAKHVNEGGHKGLPYEFTKFTRPLFCNAPYIEFQTG